MQDSNSKGTEKQPNKSLEIAVFFKLLYELLILHPEILERLKDDPEIKQLKTQLNLER